jgi:predicted nucleic acid-binding protein
LILLDTNVLVAAAVPSHVHHELSNAVVIGTDRPSVAAHSLAEFVSTVTRAGLFEWTAVAAARQVRLFGGAMNIRALDADQMLGAIERFAGDNRRGPLIYDFLIGQHAVVHNIPTIVTWNVRHMVPLFPQLRVITPSDV